jgi:uncharacterized BrkB/YihY/UPF0761 family membrane protein
MKHATFRDRFREAAIATAVCLLVLPSTARAETALETLVKRGLSLTLWIATGVCGTMGIIVFCNGVMKMWDTEDPRGVKQGKRMMFWGVFLTIAVLLAVAMREYLTAGVDFSTNDLFNASGGGG